MNTKPTIAFLLALLFSIAAEAQPDPSNQTVSESQAAAGDDPQEPCLNVLWREAMEAETNAPSGEAVGGITVADVLRRLIAGVEGVGLEEGDTSTTLTWNLNQQLAALLEVLNEPELYTPLSQAIQDDSLRERLSDRIGPGDDLSFALRYVHRRSGGSNDASAGAQMMMGRAGAFQQYRSFEAFAQSYLSQIDENDMRALLRDRESAPCPLDTDLQEMRRELSRYTAAVMNVSEGEARIYYKQRDSLVGPSQWGLSAKYTMALARADKKQKTLENLFRRSGNPVWRMLPNGPRSEPATDVDWSWTDARSLLRQQRLSLQVSYDESEDYSFRSFLPEPILLDRSRALVGTAAYSLEFPRDNSDAAALPRYEVQLSYEDVDDDPARQDRFLARAIVTKGLGFLGEAADLTFGLVYANKPEFLLQEDIDEQLSARLGLSLKLGRVREPQPAPPNQ